MNRNDYGTKLFKPHFDQINYDQFLKIISEIYSLLSLKLKDQIALSLVIEGKNPLKTNLKTDFVGKPEPFTRENVIDLLLNHLGYTIQHRTGESDLQQLFGRNYPDYKLIASSNLQILVEAEPLNEDIYNKPNAGLNQVYVWLESKRSKTDYGIATNGFEWVLVQYLVEANKKNEIKKIDLTPFFLKLLGKNVPDSTLKEIYLDFVSYFSKETAESAINGFVKIQNEKREDISKKFYERYLKTIFGVNKEGKKIYGYSLFDAIQNVSDIEERKKIAQLTVNRLIFIKFIESKGWINNNPRFLKDLKDQYAKSPTPAGFFKTYLEPLFFLALNNPSTNKPHPYENVRYLNGGLFRKDRTEETNANYNISNDELLRVIDFLEDYDFKIKGSVVHEDKETLDPEILGYIFERSANHAAGAYYTPENITAYIANQTIEARVLERINIYLREKGEKERPDIFSIFGENGLDIDHLRNLYEKRNILNIKILDPACGSGAFFIPVIRKLTDLHRRFYKEINRTNPNQYQLQKKIVEDNIYGVDINGEAIEIAKLRLWLDLLDTVENINDVDALPNIEYNVMTGNSLIGAYEIPEMSRAEFYTYYHPTKFEQIVRVYPDLKIEADALIGKSSQFNMTFKDLFLLRNKLITKYRSETHPIYAERLRDIIAQISEKFRFELSKIYFYKAQGIEKTEDLNLAITKFKPFNWIMEFSDVFENGGFDIIIGNPPYIRSEFDDLNYQEQRKILDNSTDYETLYEKWDLFLAFIERGIKILKTGGELSFIVSNSFNTSKYADKSKKYILENYHLKQIDFFKNIKVFRGVGVESVILLIEKSKNNSKTKRILHVDSFENSKEIEPSNNIEKMFRISSEINFDNKFSNSEMLGNICFISKGMVIHAEESSYKGEFKKDDLISDHPTKINKKPYIEAKYIERYKINDIKYLEWDTDRSPKKLSRPTFPELYSSPKIIRGRTTDAIFDDSGLICNESACVFVLFSSLKEVSNRSIENSLKKTTVKTRKQLEEISTGYNLKYILAVLNSKFAKFYLNSIRRHRIEYYFYSDDFKKLPIKIISIKEQQPFINLVDKILTLNKHFKEPLNQNFKEAQHLKAEINHTDEEIDRHVYDLYGLTKDEIAFIEESMGPP